MYYEDLKTLIENNEAMSALRLLSIDKDSEELWLRVANPKAGNCESIKTYLKNALKLVRSRSVPSEDIVANEADKLEMSMKIISDAYANDLTFTVMDKDTYISNVEEFLSRLEAIAYELLSEIKTATVAVTPAMLIDSLAAIKDNENYEPIIISTGVRQALNKIDVLEEAINNVVIAMNAYIGAVTVLLDMTPSPAINTYIKDKTNILHDVVSSTVRQAVKDSNGFQSTLDSTLLAETTPTLDASKSYMLSDERINDVLGTKFTAMLGSLQDLRLTELVSIYDSLPENSNITKKEMLNAKLSMDILILMLTTNGGILKLFVDSGSSDDE